MPRFVFTSLFLIIALAVAEVNLVLFEWATQEVTGAL